MAVGRASWPINTRAEAFGEIDWSTYLTCPQCFAGPGHVCQALSSGGPAALPSRPALRPHSGRAVRKAGGR